MSSTSPEKTATQTGRRHINLPKLVQAPFSDAVLVGDTLYMAGRIGIDPTTGKPPDDIEHEIRNLLDGFKAVLGEAGMTMDDLVFVQVFCPDLSLYDKFNDGYKSYFGKEYPARAFFGSGPLLRGGHFEMNGIAVRTGSRRQAPGTRKQAPGFKHQAAARALCGGVEALE